jgi:ferric-dicitrate binding protein FerR (iron transport regulator)
MVRGGYHRLLAILLCFLLIPLPIWAGNAAGQVAAVNATASRNNHPLQPKEQIDWKDVLRTDRTGRARLTLRDGSIVSLGSGSELQVVQHEPTTQQTILQLYSGRVRSRVVSITRSDGKFEVRTPTATASVVGTDFFVEYLPAGNSFRLICYSGIVQVTGNDSWAGHRESVHAGQMITINAGGFGPAQATPNAVQQDSIAQTASEGGAKVASDTHVLRNVLIGAAVAAAGVAVGLITTTGASASAGQAGSSSGGKKTQ